MARATVSTGNTNPEIAKLIHAANTELAASCFANKGSVMARQAATQWAALVGEISKKSPDKAFDAVHCAWRNAPEDSPIRNQAADLFEKMKRFGSPVIS